MEAHGLLEGASETLYLEFGAGKGYLAGMLGDLARPAHLVLMDYRSTFRSKVGRG
jgi:hypothetical protein